MRKLNKNYFTKEHEFNKQVFIAFLYDFIIELLKI